MKKLVMLPLFILFLFTDCEKINIDSSKCIEDRVRKFSKETSCDNGVAVGLYIFREENVYVFDEGNCGADMGAAVYNESCEYLGYLGGFAGNTKIGGIEFSANAQFVKIVWEK